MGKVVGISDGDTITILDSDKKMRKIRLDEIDAPESSQPYGNKSKKELSDLIYGKTVSVLTYSEDKYGRAIGKVFLNNLNVNSELIRLGAAWVYRKYSKDESLIKLELEAKSRQLGLWSLSESERIPPWEWRKVIKKNQIHNNKSQETYECGNKTKCKEMVSCQEAMLYLQNCGLNNLDGNRDGIPCTSICR